MVERPPEEQSACLAGSLLRRKEKSEERAERKAAEDAEKIAEKNAAVTLEKPRTLKAKEEKKDF